MFDRDGNKRVDRDEFLVIRELISMLRSLDKIASLERHKGTDRMDTTLLRYFFGQSGTDTLLYQDFETFYDDLQTEILEIEFNMFSGGRRTISEIDFAKILFRYTILHHDDYKEYLANVQRRIRVDQGITFDQFRQFCLFLNNLDDFSTAVKLHTMAGQPISQAEFARAVNVSTGMKLDEHVVNTVFRIFDVNDDGRLSYYEFIAVMTDRIHRGFKSHRSKDAHGWTGFKACVRDELRAK